MGMGGVVKHSFSNTAYNSELRSKTNLLDPGYEFSIGVKLANRIDLLIGINSEVGHLNSSPYRYEVNYNKINYPLLLRFHFSSHKIYSNFLSIGVSWGKFLQRSTYGFNSLSVAHDYNDGLWMNARPYNVMLGVGRAISVSERSNLVINPFLSYELSNNFMLKEFFNPFTIGVKASYEFNFK